MQTDDNAWEETEELETSPLFDENAHGSEEPRSRDPRYTLLEMELEGKDAAYRSRVFELVHLLKINPQDPVFLLLIATGRIDSEIRQFPQSLSRYRNNLSTLFDRWSDQVMTNLDEYERVIKQRLEAYQQVASKMHQREMDKMLRTLIAKVAIKEVLHHPFVLILSGVVTLASVGTGALLSYFYWQAKTQYEPGSKQLTVEQAKALQWAQSPEGRYARSLFEWNQGLLENKSCVEQARRAAVSVQVTPDGQKATSGFCLLWVDPPNKRQFESAPK
ncbi:DUF6753 family protein [Leptolyngbya sp. AN03gr2]|uniref:DUF6753 family protein n=1 Tax=unclassified Leptolyngbya TaxID=2650499 RepID=UPI003D31D1EA